MKFNGSFLARRGPFRTLPGAIFSFAIVTGPNYPRISAMIFFLYNYYVLFNCCHTAISFQNIQMSNSRENSSDQPTSQQKGNFHFFYNFIYLLHTKSYDKPLIASLLYCINSLEILLIFLNLEKVSIFPSEYLQLPLGLGLSLLLYVILIGIQFLLGLGYQKQFLLVIQFRTYRCVFFILGFRFILKEISREELIPAFVAIMLLIFVLLLTIFFTLYLGVESYYKQLMKQDGMPINFGLLCWDLVLCWYERNTVDKTINNVPIIVFLIVIGIINRFWILDGIYKRSKCSEYHIYSVMSSINLIYTTTIGFLEVYEEANPRITFYPLLFLFVLLALSEYSYRRYLPQKNLFDVGIHIEEFLYLTQFIVEDLMKLNEDQKSNLHDTCILSFYYQHVKNCKIPDCNQAHEVVNSLLLQVSKDFHSGNTKNITLKLCRCIEKLFLHFCQKQPENVTLKIIFIRFYILSFENKLKILELLSELQSSHVSFFEKILIYEVKEKLLEMQVSEVFENLKIQDAVIQFKNTMNIILSTLLDFWSQFFQERVDFSKVIIITDKIFPYIESMQQQVKEALKSETYSSIKVLSIYAEYTKTILNDETYGTVVEDYVDLVCQKLEEMKEISYMSGDSELGLIVLSLSEVNLGQIKMCNTQAGYIFDYPKKDLLKKKINEIMPKIFAANHDYYLQVFLKNKNKKVNTDERLLVGKNKNGYIFPIFLQLRKAMISMNDELVFIANIRTVKQTESATFCICSDQGEILDYSSMFYYLFIKKLRKKDEKVSAVNENKNRNIQEFITQFFDNMNFDEDHEQTKVFYQQIDHHYQGIVDIQFHVSYLNFPRKPHAGYLIRGFRHKPTKLTLFPELSLTKVLADYESTNQLQSRPISYNTEKNTFSISEGVVKMKQYECLYSQTTIPYLKLSQLVSVIDEKPKTANYDGNIKAIRLIHGHFERIQDPDSFHSDIDSNQLQEKNDKLVEIKSELITKEGLPFSSCFSCSTNIICVLLISFSIFTIIYRNNIQSQTVTDSLEYSKNRYQTRSLLAEYAVYFQAIYISSQSEYFKEKKTAIRQEAIMSINNAKLPQPQKQLTFKLIYLQNESQLQELIKQQTFKIQSDKEESYDFLTIAIIVFSILLLIKIILNICFLQHYKSKLFEIYQFFLPIEESSIRKLHDNCLKLSKKLSQKAEDIVQKKEGYQDDEQFSQEQEENPVKKIKKFKNLSSNRDQIQIVQFLLPTFVVCAFFCVAAIVLNDFKMVKNSKVETYDYLEKMLPQYSVKMMKSYLNKIYSRDFNVTDQFTEKYQNMDYGVSELEELELQSQHFTYLFNDPCEYLTNPHLECSTICNGVLTTGISKAANYISMKLQKYGQDDNTTTEQFTKLIKVLYDAIKPIHKNIAKQVRDKINLLNEKISLTSTILFSALILLVLLMTFYEYNYPLKTMQKQFKSTKSLIKLIPERKQRNQDGYEKI